MSNRIVLITFFGFALTSCSDKDGDAIPAGEDGVDGKDGEDGNNALVLIEEEPPGDNCENGGTVIYYGTDDNDNGVTLYLPNGTSARRKNIWEK